MQVIAAQVVAIIGLLISIYAMYEERRVRTDASYHPVCDINNKVSCSRAFSSEYGKTFGISNSIGGIGFYIGFLALTLVAPQLAVYLAAFFVLGSVYLGYLQYVKIRTFCIVCTSIYAVNLLLLLLSI